MSISSEITLHDQAFQIWLDFIAYNPYDNAQYGGNDIEAYVLKEHIENYGDDPFVYAYLTEDANFFSGAQSGLQDYLIDDVQILQNPNDLSYDTYLANLAGQYGGSIPDPYLNTTGSTDHTTGSMALRRIQGPIALRQTLIVMICQTLMITLIEAT